MFVPDPIPSNKEDIESWMFEQFDKLSNVLQSLETEGIIFTPLHEEPDKPEEGLVVWADGSDWNPGAGPGKYTYTGTVWVKGGVSYLYKDTAYNTSSIGTGVSIGTVPSGGIILPHHVNITTAYNAATTNVLELGTTGDPDHYVAVGDVDETTIAFTANITTGCEEVASDTEVFVKYTESGTAATAGASTVILPYII